jgi:peroxiredoxin
MRIRYALAPALVVGTLVGCAGGKTTPDGASDTAVPAEPGPDGAGDGDSDDAADGDPGGDSSGDSGDDGTEPVVGLEVGLRVPDFSLPDPSGTLVSLSDFRGKRIIIMGTAAWCPGCQDLVEKIEEWYVNSAQDDQMAISVLIEDTTGDVADLEDADAWRERHGLTYPVLADVDQEWRATYSAGGDYPQRTYLVVDSDGIIVFFQQDGDRARRSDLIEAIDAAE